MHNLPSPASKLGRATGRRDLINRGIGSRATLPAAGGAPGAAPAARPPCAARCSSARIGSPPAAPPRSHREQLRPARSPCSPGVAAPAPSRVPRREGAASARQLPAESRAAPQPPTWAAHGDGHGPWQTLPNRVIYTYIYAYICI